ncbi:RNA polymerase sigma-70 factor, ECF subfamily [Aquimarina amphilecti]|uniref:RNA polymerase sigma-70 factor, ECF subfamily n=1 Tax=Aquimarina amphilecti TaxID=1038014 RepID=A0A1H7TJ63_AQUAM|nr:RNA polymerase sigma-70 factor [Aquimarina amphilecti]SEL84718.1 RNA polymerase sigma-70 factor, ECF subfamily [Aquimarina amphilecti]
MKYQNHNIEKSLIKGLRDGNQKSYKILFDQYYNWLCNYVYKLSKNNALSEDLVQNVFLRLWEKKSTLHITSSLRNYLFRSCHNEYLMHLRQQKKEIDLLDELKWKALFQLYQENEKLQQEEDWLKIEKAIAKLPRKCQEVFKLSRLEQKKHKEIAEILGISTKTVEIHITKALRFLKTNVSGFFF